MSGPTRSLMHQIALFRAPDSDSIRDSWHRPFRWPEGYLRFGHRLGLDQMARFPLIRLGPF